MKKVVLMIVCLMLGMVASAQKTSLVIDNQTPGWLSSKINYGDQKTLKSIKVTGYVNKDDLDFVFKLCDKYSLSKVDLGDVDIVEYDKGYENYNGSSKRLSYLAVPKSWNKMFCVFYPALDTLVEGGGNRKYIDNASNGEAQDGRVPVYGYGKVKVLILREGTEKIGAEAFQSNAFSNVVFPKTIKNIGECAFVFHNSINDTYDDNNWRPKVFVCPDSLKELDAFIVRGDDCEEIRLNDNCAVIGASSSVKGLFGNALKKVYSPRKTPPTFWVNDKDSLILKNCIVYVPYGCTSAYKKVVPWKYATIIEDTVHVTGVVVEPTEMEIEAGKTATIKASVLPADADNTSVVWSSSDEAVAVVSASGEVIGKKSGTALITATSEENKEFKAVCKVHVVNPVKKVTLGEHELSLKAKETRKLTASVEPANADDGRVVWKSSDTKVVSVNNDGEITAVKAGKAFVFATAAANETIKDSCLVTVTQSVTGITLDKKSIHSSTIGEVVQLTATVLPDDADDKRVNWASSKPEVCTVSPSGAIVVLADGTSVVTATTLDGGFVAVCTVEVSSAGGVEGVAADDVDYTDAKWYDIDGREATYLKKGGVYIVKPKTGKAKKVVIR